MTALVEEIDEYFESELYHDSHTAKTIGSHPSRITLHSVIWNASEVLDAQKLAKK